MKIFYNKAFKNYLLLAITLFLSEIIFRCVVHLPLLDWSMLRIFIGVNILSLILGGLYSLCGRIVNNVLCFVTCLISSVYAIAQAGFENYLGVYVSFGTSSQLGAVRDYFSDYIESFSWTFWLILIPLIILLAYYIFIDKKIDIQEKNDTIDFADKFDSKERKEKNDKQMLAKKKKRNINGKIDALIIALALAGIYYFTLTASFMQNKIQLKTNKELFVNPDMPNIAVSQFGYSVYAILDVKNVILPSSNELENQYALGYQKHKQVQSDYTRNIDDTVWEQIIEDENKKNYKILNNYYISQEITDKNDYTGLFKDKNLIVIMMESSSNVLINEELFPNIYKLYNEGWAWENAYSPRNSCSTGNNEMSGMTSLFTINNSCTANIYKKNIYPESLFNLFNEKGYTTSSYHNYTEKYYSRKTIHPNMGSGKYYGVQALGIPYSNAYEEWPSDVELMDKFLDITQDEEKFMAWLTTVSSHQPYGKSSELGDKNLDLFEDTEYNTSLKRYLSKLKVLDESIGTLVEGLEKQGKLEDTVIVLFSDHYPYGLSDNTLNQYYDYDVNKNNEVDRTPFIIYNPSLEATKFSEYTTYMNITPTLANLFDLDYDPRLYAGKDILSDNYENRVIFADGSWQDDKAFYNATTGKIEYFDSNNVYTTEEINNINKTISDRISMSNLAIKTDYFNYLYNKFDEYKVESIPTSSETTSNTEIAKSEKKSKEESDTTTE